jgi:phage replication O-like protein O
MANPQIENGFTKISNELLEAILRSNLTQRELKIIFVIIRFTYGFNRNEAELSVRFIEQATSIKYHHVSGIISKMLSKSIIFSNPSSKKKNGRMISLNKNYEEWNLVSSIESNSSLKSTDKVPKMVTTRVPQKVTKKEIKRKNKKMYSHTSDEVRLSSLLLSLIQNRNPNYKKPNIQNWAKHIDLMIRLDKRTSSEIENIIEWCQSDSFWQNNILSTEKLRKQFDQLVMKSKELIRNDNRINFSDFSDKSISKGKYATVYQ